VDPT